MEKEDDTSSVQYFGVALIVVGLIVFVLSGANFSWLATHGYILNAPAMMPIVFLALGATFIFIGSKRKTTGQLG